MKTRSNQTTKAIPKRSLPYPKKHKVGYQEKLTTTTNQASPSCPLPISKDTDPRLEADEINRLAKSWCGLVLGFIQERNRINSSVPFFSLQGKIDIGKG